MSGREKMELMAQLARDEQKKIFGWAFDKSIKKKDSSRNVDVDREKSRKQMKTTATDRSRHRSSLRNERPSEEHIHPGKCQMEHLDQTEYQLIPTERFGTTQIYMNKSNISVILMNLSKVDHFIENRSAPKFGNTENVKNAIPKRVQG